MIEQDTIRLLRECNAGIKMGVTTLEETLPNVESTALRHILEKSKDEHESLGNRTRQLLERYQDEGKEPSAMAKGMGWMKTNVKLAVEPGDGTVADLITDGCNMGVKSLSKYLNQYAAAEEKAKDIAKELIHLEEKLSTELRGFLR
jgi:hypothetical protein